MCTVVKHCRDIAADLSESVLADNREHDAGRAYVLLCATINEGIFADVNRTAHDI